MPRATPTTFLHEWDIFSGYVLLAPEKVNLRNRCSISVPRYAKDFYRKEQPFIMRGRRRTRYAVAAVGYAKEIEQKDKGTDSTKFYFHRQSPGRQSYQ